MKYTNSTYHNNITTFPFNIAFFYVYNKLNQSQIQSKKNFIYILSSIKKKNFVVAGNNVHIKKRCLHSKHKKIFVYMQFNHVYMQITILQRIVFADE